MALEVEPFSEYVLMLGKAQEKLRSAALSKFQWIVFQS